MFIYNNLMIFLNFFLAYKTVSSVNGPLVVLDHIKVMVSHSAPFCLQHSEEEAHMTRTIKACLLYMQRSRM